jgi:hypothetical protein
LPHLDNFMLLCARLAAIAVAALAFSLAVVATADAATRLVAPVGADVGNCTLTPCRSLGYAYGQSASGDVVTVAPGVYGAQEVPRGSRAVTFRGAAATRLRELDNSASNVTFDNITVDAGFSQTTAFENHGADNVTFKNASIGNVTDEKGALISGTGFTFDNVFVHDVRVTASSVHNECVYAIGVERMTVRNSRFRACATMDIFFTYGSWWSPLPPAYGHVTLENNVFGHSTDTGGPDTWHYYSVAVAATGPNGGTLDHWTVRHNTFEIPANIERDRGPGTVWIGNLGSWNCVSGVSYARNVGKACAGSDKRIEPASSARLRIAPLGWLDPANHDFHLRAGSPAINTGVPSDAPATDRDGLLRDSRPDAGAYEFGARAPGAGSGGGGALRILSARLKPRVICVRARRGCRASTRLHVAVSTAARVNVRIKRLRKGHRARRVRAFSFRADDRGRAKIKGRRLGKGRYRVVVRAVVFGQHSPARALRLRVR